MIDDTVDAPEADAGQRALQSWPPRRPRPDYMLYERLKAAWITKHPLATSGEYESAMRRIAKEAGG